MKKENKSFGSGVGAIILSLACFGSYIAGFLRDLILANMFGAGVETDAFFAGFLIPDFLFNFLILGFVSGALLPVFLSAEKRSKTKAQELFRSFLFLSSLGILLFSALTFFLAPWIIDHFFSMKYGGEHRSKEEIQSILDITRILLISPFLFGISNTLGTILLAKKHFLSIAISPILYNSGIIIGMLFFGQTYGIEAAAWGAVFGAFLHLLSRIIDFPSLHISLFRKEKRYPLRKDFLYLPKIYFSPEIKAVFFLGIPRMLGLISFQIVLILFSLFAGKVQDGGIAAWNFARNIQSLSVSLFGISVATASLPFLSEFFTRREHANFIQKFSTSALQILFFTLPATVGLIILSHEIVAAIFEHGAFDSQAKHMTVSILIGIACAIPFESLVHLLSRAFLAKKDTLTPALGKVLFLVVAACIVFFSSQTGNIGILGIAFCSASVAELSFLGIRFHRTVFSLPVKKIWNGLWKMLLLSSLTGVIVFQSLSVTKYMGEYIQLGVSISCGVGFYFFGAYFLDMPEIKNLLFSRRKKE
jgi:putative peptidoglycan lipid II flippase